MLGTPAQAPVPPPPPLVVVTLIELLCADIPNESLAATVKLYVVEAVKPDTVKLVPLLVPIELPFSKTV
jgi:hypothetical protein